MKDNPNDKVYTPDFIVDEVLGKFSNMWDDSCTFLEPFKGGGAFYNKLPQGSDYCEIDEGIDFFDYQGKVDWIVTNPPYSIFDKVLGKMLEVANNVLIVIPANKLLSSMPRLMDIKRAGMSITHIHYLGSGRQLKFPFGFPVAAVLIQKVDTDCTEISYSDRCYQAKKKKKQNR